MFKEFRELSIRTMIGQLPGIINENNNIIKKQFDDIYDSSNGVLMKSVNTTLNGQSGDYVKSHLGEFTNLVTDNIIITSNNNSNETKWLSHQMLNGRYGVSNSSLNNGSVSLINSTSSDVLNKNYCHNAHAIGVKFQNNVYPLSYVLDSIINKLGILPGLNGEENLKVQTWTETYNEYVLDENGEKIPIEWDEYGNPTKYQTQAVQKNRKTTRYGAVNPQSNVDNLKEPNSFTFDKNLLFASKVQLKRMNLPEYQYNDITSGQLYTYYDYAPIVTINDENISSISGETGYTIKIKFNDKSKKAFYRIILSRKDKTTLRISKDELVRLTLICIDNDEKYGTSWDVDSYSIRNAEDLIIERK